MITEKKIVKKNRNIVILLILFGAAFLNAFSVKNFVSREQLLPSGISGLSVLFQYISKILFDHKISFYYFYILLNLPILIWAQRKLKGKIVLRTIQYVFMFTLCSVIMPDIKLSSDQIINSIAGGIANGLSISMLLYVGSSGGGMDLIGLYISKVYKKNFVGKANFILNVIIFVILGIIINPEKALLSLCSSYVSSVLIDKLHAQSNYVMLMIVTNHKERFIEYINEKMHRSSTVLDSVGSYTLNENNTMFVTISKFKYAKVVKDLKKIDSKSYIVTIKLEDVHGNTKSFVGESVV